MTVVESTTVMATRKLYESDAKEEVKFLQLCLKHNSLLLSCMCIITYSFKTGYDVQHCILDKIR